MAITTAPEPPIIVNGTTLPATLFTFLRYLIVTTGTALVTSGRLPADQLEGLVTTLITAATFGYGVWKSKQRQGQLIVAADAAPDRVAKVVR